MKPTRYIFNLGLAFKVLLRAIGGRVVPQPKVDRADALYGELTQRQVDLVIPTVHWRMVNTGWIRKAWRFRNRDCENYCQRFITELVDLLWDEVGEARGVPAFRIWYTRDSDEKQHELVLIRIGKKDVFYEAMPEIKYLQPKILTNSEVASISRVEG